MTETRFSVNQLGLFMIYFTFTKPGATGIAQKYRPVPFLSCLTRFYKERRTKLFQVVAILLDGLIVMSPCQRTLICARGTQPLLQEFCDSVFSF